MHTLHFTVQMSEHCQFMIIIYTNHKTFIYNIIINKGQSYVFSKSESFWLACLTRAVKIHQLSKTSAESVIFTDFHGLDNGRTYSHKLSKNVALTPTTNRLERSIQLKCGRWRGWGGSELVNLQFATEKEAPETSLSLRVG